MRSYDTLSANFGLTPNDYSFIKHVKMTSAIPLTWQDETQSNQHFLLFKEKIIQLITLLGKSNKTVYSFLRNKNKVLPIKQQQNGVKFCKPYPHVLIGLKFTTTITLQPGKPNCDPSKSD